MTNLRRWQTSVQMFYSVQSQRDRVIRLMLTRRTNIDGADRMQIEAGEDESRGTR